MNRMEFIEELGKLMTSGLVDEYVLILAQYSDGDTTITKCVASNNTYPTFSWYVNGLSAGESEGDIALWRNAAGEIFTYKAIDQIWLCGSSIGSGSAMWDRGELRFSTHRTLGQWLKSAKMLL